MAIAVDWRALAEAVAYYERLGYHYIEADWIVAPQYVAMTTDRGVMTVPGHGDLVGSAEQSLLALEASGALGRGWFLACTPCFRDEPVIDDLHQRTFMKVELYRNIQYGTLAVEDMLESALGFFRRQLPACTHRDLAVVTTAEGQDITLGGVEIGSYGLRTVGDHSWVYGTGLAEPRFSTARARLVRPAAERAA